MTPDHVRWEDERAAYLLDALDPPELEAFEDHLAGCERCRAELRWLEPAVDVLPAAVDQIDPPAELRRRILGAVEADAPPRQRERAPARPSLWGRLAARPAALGVAALAALAVGLAGGYALRGEPEPQVVTQTVPVEGTAPAIRAVGNVVQHDDNWTLDVSRMPELRPGDVYQVWIRRGKRVLPSVLFVMSHGNHARVALPARMESVDQLMVTREPSGGSLEPTSAPLVSATLQ